LNIPHPYEDGIRTPNAADDWIVKRAEPNAIMITADILVAGRGRNEGARVIDPTGKPFTDDNPGGAAATRDLLSSMRDAGVMTSGPRPSQRHDRSRFLQQLGQVIQAIRREFPE